MPIIELRTVIDAPVERCFDLARDIDLHIESTAGTDERAVGGVTTGLIGLGEEVTWEAIHFGVRQRLTSRITRFARPSYFRDTMVRGAFRSFDHDHFFTIEENGATLMRDVFDYRSPFGAAGRIADRLFLRRYMERLLTERARVIQRAAETGWRPPNSIPLEQR